MLNMARTGIKTSRWTIWQMRFWQSVETMPTYQVTSRYAIGNYSKNGEEHEDYVPVNGTIAKQNLFRQ